MALTELWKSNRNELEQKNVQQVIGFAGDGRLRDGGSASEEFREFLKLVPSQTLGRYAEECLEDRFDGSGLTLQDIINQVGGRLGFKVEQGRYRGTPRDVGFDGLWQAPDGNVIVVEVKTTDAYRIDLNTVATYRRKLIAEKRLEEERSSILIIVGRSDTGDLEAQVRGSRHAWDVRMISIDALLRLMRLKEELGDPKIISKIRRVLMPQEFTKVDGIIDLVFSAAEEVKKEEEQQLEEPGEDRDQAGPQPRKKAGLNFRDACATRIQAKLGVELIKRSAALYSSPDESTVVVCINSREYERANGAGFWYAFHPHQKESLQQAKAGYVGLGCGSEKRVLLFPADAFLAWLPIFHVTDDGERSYWHVRVEARDNEYTLRVKKGNKPVDATPFLIRD